MEKIFSKTSFPKAPGGDRYEWKEVETIFEVPKDGRYAIAITASAKNGKQNGTGDDDDLRVAINGYDFGKYEVHDETVSWKGFGASAAWDGASLKDASKTVYFLIDIQARKGDYLAFNEKRQQVLQFFADGKPTLQKIEVFELAKEELFSPKDVTPPQNILTDEKGIPWLSLVFLGTKPKAFTLQVSCRSGKQKNGSDGDNLKVAVNGKILPHPKASTSDTYKNFFFSGDQLQGKTGTLNLFPRDFVWFENAVELWYDQTPTIEQLEVSFFNASEDFLNYFDIKPEEYYRDLAYRIVKRGRLIGRRYSADFLEHSLQKNPENLIFSENDKFVKKLKKDPAYPKLLGLVQEKIQRGILDGEIRLGGREPEVNFETKDLATALHGIKKIEYIAHPKGNQYEVSINLFDIYDFKNLPFKEGFHPIDNYVKFYNNTIFLAELRGIVNNFEIKINLKETIKK